MKNTLTVLLTLSGIVVGADYTTKEVWGANFGSEYQGGYEITGTLATPGTFHDVSGQVTEEGVVTHGNKRPHLAGGVYGSWDEDFQFAVTLTLGDTIKATDNSSNWPVFAELRGNGTDLRFGPYVNMNNGVGIDSDGNKLTKGEGLLASVEPGGTYTITLTKIGTALTVAVDGVTAAMGTLSDSASGNITDIGLGGNTGSNHRMNSTIHSISWSTIMVPEPATATLGLLALAGLAARRRRG